VISASDLRKPVEVRAFAFTCNIDHNDIRGGRIRRPAQECLRGRKASGKRNWGIGFLTPHVHRGVCRAMDVDNRHGDLGCRQGVRIRRQLCVTELIAAITGDVQAPNKTSAAGRGSLRAV
jgi:hypothetical protein